LRVVRTGRNAGSPADDGAVMMPNEPQADVATWFGPPERPLAGWIHTPQEPRSGVAAVLCPPLGVEQTNAHYTLRQLSIQLAEAGIASVRFDYDGTGDSAGGDEDPGRLEAWVESIGHAVTLARQHGAKQVALVGLRMGGLLAALAERRFGPFQAMVLWDPCASGRAFVREQRTLHMVRWSGLERSDGSVELPGFVMSAETVSALNGVVLPAPGVQLTTRTLVLSRPGVASSPILAEVSASDDHTVECGEANEQAEFLDVDPFFHQIPFRTLHDIVRWLTGVFEDGVGALSPVQTSGDGRTPAAQRNLAVVAHANGRAIVERMVRLGPNGLFAIETSPESPLGRTSSPTVLFFNSGNERHVGPNRLWVRLARQWAGYGVRSVRFDMSGLGESPARSGQEDHVIRAPEAFDDVEDVAAAVSGEDPSNVIFVGLCSGAYQALESGLLLSPRGVCAVNPLLRFAPPEMAYGPIDRRRRTCRPRSPLVQAYVALPFPRLRDLARPIMWRWANWVPGPSRPKRWLADLVGAGVRTLIVCGPKEAVPVYYGAKRTVRKLEATGVLRTEALEEPDHALLLARQRERVAALLTDQVLGHFDRTHARVSSDERTDSALHQPSVATSA